MARISLYYSYIALSNLLVVAFAADAFLTFEQFYPSVGFLTSSRAFGIMAHNAVIANILLCGSALRKIFFGTLLPVERQRLHEEFFVQVFESCIGLAYFQGVMTTMLTIAFALTTFLKMFHLLATARLESIERSVQRPTNSIRRLAVFLALVMILDGYVMLSCASHIYERGVNIYLMLLLSYCVMTLNALVTQIKLVLYLRDEGTPAPNAARFYIDIFSTIADGMLYICFFAAMTRVAMPLHLVRDLLRSIKNILTTIRSLFRYQRLAANIDKVFEVATREDLDRDRRCAVCYDDMLDDTNCKRLDCGHCYHRDCLRKWLESNSACPYCRKDMVAKFDLPKGRAAALDAAMVARNNAARGVAAPDVAAPDVAAPDVARAIPRNEFAPAAENGLSGGQQSPVGQQPVPPPELVDAAVDAAYADYLRLHAQSDSGARLSFHHTSAQETPSSTVADLQAQLHAYEEYKQAVDAATRRLEAKLLILRVQSTALAVNN
jgi:E3 ubiquitin-protein ligase synoviolin